MTQAGDIWIVSLGCSDVCLTQGFLQWKMSAGNNVIEESVKNNVKIPEMSTSIPSETPGNPRIDPG